MFFQKFFGKEKTAVIIKPWICVRRRTSLVLAFALRVPGQSNKIAGATKANIVVRVTRRVIQFRCECPGVVAIIPIAAADESTLRYDLSFPLS